MGFEDTGSQGGEPGRPFPGRVSLGKFHPVPVIVGNHSRLPAFFLGNYPTSFLDIPWCCCEVSAPLALFVTTWGPRHQLLMESACRGQDRAAVRWLISSLPFHTGKLALGSSVIEEPQCTSKHQAVCKRHTAKFRYHKNQLNKPSEEFNIPE